METKKCSRCKQLKSLDDFYKLTKSSDGRSSICKECDKEKGRLRREANRCSERVRVKAWRESNPALSMLKAARRRAKDNGLPCTITEKDVVVPEFCPIFGIKLTFGRNDVWESRMSLDKIVPSLGYVPGNVAVISNKANTIKNSGTADEHRRIADWMDAQTQSTQEFNVIDPELIEFGRELGERLLENTKRAIDEAVTGLAPIPVGSYFDKNPRLAPMSLSPAQTKEAA